MIEQQICWKSTNNISKCEMMTSKCVIHGSVREAYINENKKKMEKKFHQRMVLKVELNGYKWKGILFEQHINYTNYCLDFNFSLSMWLISRPIDNCQHWDKFWFAPPPRTQHKTNIHTICLLSVSVGACLCTVCTVCIGPLTCSLKLNLKR